MARHLGFTLRSRFGMLLAITGCYVAPSERIGTSSSSSDGPVHVWTFNRDGTDSVGGATAALHGSARISRCRVDLDGNGYVSLPIDATVAGLTDATFEAWATWSAGQPYWERIFDFGMNTGKNMFFTPSCANGPYPNHPRFTGTVLGPNSEEQINEPTPFPTDVPVHVVITIQGPTWAMYLNGSLVGSIASATLSPSSIGATPNNYLGRSQYPDPLLVGSIDEFRIYDRALSANEVQASYQAGPTPWVWFSS